ncbi:MAG TPA: hypothetical protein VFO05_11615, partial [Candidatus Limnocylindrales bacterium]|nr:hypothetical protein [Candidatus Limnocylindrales bacterium]
WRRVPIRATIAGDPWEDTRMTDERPAETPDDQAAAETIAGADSTAASGAAGADTTNREAPGEGAWTDPTDASGSKMVSQLQTMIDSIATQAGPVAKQVGAKAAELAAVAAERAGPFARKAGDATADASVRIAQRSRELAADLRRELSQDSNGTSPDTGSTATAVMDRPPVETPVEPPAENDQG